MDNGKKLKWKVGGMHCSSCVQLVTQELMSLEGVKDAKVSLSAGEAVLELDDKAEAPSVIEAGEKLSAYGFTLHEDENCKACTAAGNSKDRVSGRVDTGRPESNGKAGVIEWLKASALAFAMLAVFALLQNSGVISFSGMADRVENSGWPVFALVMGLAASVSSCLAVTGSFVISFSMLYSGKGTDQKQNGGKREGVINTGKKSALYANIFFQAGRMGGFALLGALLGAAGGSISLTGNALGITGILLSLLLFASAFSILGGRFAGWINLRTPKILNRFILKVKTSSSPFAPALLGALTFFLPCGFTQSMQLAALGSNSPAAGAVIMFLFSLGTFPVLFAAGITAGWSVKRGAVVVQRAAGLVIAVFAIITFSGALPLLGYSGNVLGSNAGNEPAGIFKVNKQTEKGNNESAVAENKAPAVSAGTDGQNVQHIEMRVTLRGFEPRTLTVKKGVPVVWTIHGDQVTGCTNAIIIPAMNARIPLKEGENRISFTPQQAGVINYSCWMNMVRGVIRVTD